jgi:ATP-binding cassette, subfamily A (ABC1), member 12
MNVLRVRADRGSHPLQQSMDSQFHPIGLDPGARHLAWRVLKAEDGDDVELPAILLSTHYMDEASKLGDRVGIMIDGEIASVGSLSELRSEYCNSYFVEISLVPTGTDSSSQQRILDLLSHHDIPSHVYESLPHRFKVQIPFGSKNQVHLLADIFELLDSQKSAMGIQFFSVSQMSLEQIFIDLSRRQFDPKLGQHSERPEQSCTAKSSDTTIVERLAV